jgi:hypothetical protein
MHALVNGSTLECDTPDNWAKNYPNALNKNDLGSTFRPGLGCKSGKTPNDADNECNLGSHIIVCADSNFAKISTGEQKVVVDSSPQLVKGKKIEGKTYISSQNLVTWLGQAISTLTPNFNDFYCKEDGTLVQPYAFGKCLGGADTVCARHSDCEIYACSTGKCALKEFAGTGVSVKTIEGYGEKLANKPSFKDRLSNLFQAVYKLYEWSIGTIKLADYKYTANPIIGEVSIKSAMIDIGDKITWEGNSGADFSGDLSKSGTIPPVVSGHIKSQSGSDVALLNTITVKTSVGSYLTGDVVGRNGILGAQIEFYAWADKDHMPLRQVMVDFGSQQDIIGAANENQRYMNHKPTCGGADGVIGECAGYEGLVCTSNSECDLATGGKSKLCNQVQSFGNSANACFSGYFSYFGMYQCKNKQMNTLPACPGGAKILDSADYIANHPSYSKGCWDADYYDEELNAQTGACIYFPRVQVKDNWEWCNGKCAGQSDKGCFMSNCQQDKYSTSINPWTYFKGKVLVTP